VSAATLLAPGAHIHFTASHVMTQADIDAGSVTNHATGHGFFGQVVVNSNQAEATVNAVQTPALTLAKSADPLTYNNAGDTIAYSYTLTNSGNVTLSGPFTITDDKVSVTVDSATSLAPGAHIHGTASHVMTQDDVDAGSVTNLATGHGFFGTTPVNSNQATATVTAGRNPSLALTKSADPTTYSAVGDTITYSYTLTNNGNVTLTGPFTITDDKVSVTVDSATSLAPGAHIHGTASHVMTQADLDVGMVTNLATGHGFFGTTPITSNQATATVTAVPAPALTLVKSALPVTYGAVGDTITYSYTLTNSGNVTLMGPFTVTDDKVTVAVSPTGLLIPGGSIGFTASHVMTQADLDAGSVTNHATGHGFFGQVPVNSNQAEATVTAVQTPALTIDKTTTTESFYEVGDVIHYDYAVTNSGNVTLTGPWAVHDDKATVDVSSAPASLAPGAHFDVSADYTVTQADVDAGLVTNVAYVTGTFGERTITSPTDTVTVTAIHPAISVAKTSDAPAEGVPTGSTVIYTFVVTNTGDVPLVSVSLVDDKLGTIVTGETLAVGQSKTFTKSGVLTESTTNIVTASGFDADQHEVTDTATADVEVYLPFTPPDLTITKAASVSHAGPEDVVTYTLEYRNLSGDAPEDFTITDTYDSRYMTVVNASGGDTSTVGTIVWTIPGPLHVEDGWQTITYTMRVKSEIPSGTTHVKNTVVIYTPEDSNTGNDSDSEVVDISEELPFLPFTGGPFSPLPLYSLLMAAAGMALLLGLRRRRDA
jgi:uncharacterized repeat protein (TIGR01451 family)